MDLRNSDHRKTNLRFIATRTINHNIVNHMTNTETAGNSKLSAGSNSIENLKKKSSLIPTITSSNKLVPNTNLKHKNVYNTETYIACNRRDNLRKCNSQKPEAPSSQEACYMSNSIDELNTTSLPDAYSFVMGDNGIQDEPNDTSLNLNDKIYAEKATYCRPIFNMYNQEFIFKTMERNAKLQRLVKRLIEARQLERRRDAWNNYINDLKNKHRNTMPLKKREPNDIIYDYYNPNIEFKQSNSCRNILQDFYNTRGNAEYANYNYDDNSAPIPDYNPYICIGNNLYCYPTASQGRLRAVYKETSGNSYVNNSQNRHQGQYDHGNTVIIDRDNRNPNMSRYYPKKETVSQTVDAHFKSGMLSRSVSIQRDLNFIPGFKSAESFGDKFNTVSRNIDNLNNKIIQHDARENENSLTNIENKLNNLITTINKVLLEIKSNKPQSNTEMGINCKFSDENKLSAAKSDTFGLSSKLKSSTYAQNVTKSTIDFADAHCNKSHYDTKMDKINEILNEEIDKSNKIKQDIDRLLTTKVEKPCSVQITFDVPTKERSTEVTASLSKAKVNSKNIEEIDRTRNIDDRMTIAVNTDPLSLLALLRISTETVKQMLSSMPNIDYYSYLSMLQPLSRSTGAHYVCNICGAAFIRPSQLSNHIQEHNLGKTRDCCVCRHVLDLQRQPHGLFACKYCGQRFTRAYCCELHQETCAKILGMRHDVNSDLLLLT